MKNIFKFIWNYYSSVLLCVFLEDIWRQFFLWLLCEIFLLRTYFSDSINKWSTKTSKKALSALNDLATINVDNKKDVRFFSKVFFEAFSVTFILWVFYGLFLRNFRWLHNSDLKLSQEKSRTIFIPHNSNKFNKLCNNILMNSEKWIFRGNLATEFMEKFHRKITRKKPPERVYRRKFLQVIVKKIDGALLLGKD